ncbi:hypothetical protein JMJ35_009328 [Cladonia borealis]|uniref:Uncharacterized protein n=1 Tax=Cladonia borealis TaxID=184061 RepID=A0AA39V258_9LECA|nr:hypothetical protein JMJ35_009328 [Cladonia borealis]
MQSGMKRRLRLTTAILLESIQGQVQVAKSYIVCGQKKANVGFSELVDSLTCAIASGNVVPRLTANALLRSEKAVKIQLEDWLEKPQRHEWLAVGDVATRYDAKTRMYHDCSGDDPTRAVLAGATGSLVKERTDMDHCLEKLQGHEWLAIGGVSSSVCTETKTTPEDNGEDLNRRMLAVEEGSSMEREGRHLEDRSDKPPKFELLTLREYGSGSPAKTDEFFADIDEILSGKTE